MQELGSCISEGLCVLMTRVTNSFFLCHNQLPINRETTFIGELSAGQLSWWIRTGPYLFGSNSVGENMIMLSVFDIAVNCVVLINSGCELMNVLESPQSVHDPLNKRVQKSNTNTTRLPV